MANEVIKGNDLILYTVINGVNKAICTTKDCKLNISGDLLPTTTKDGGKGSRYEYSGKYNYSLSVSGLTSFIDVTPLDATFQGSSVESVTPYLDAASQFKINGVVIDDLYGTGTTPVMAGVYGLPYSIEFIIQNASSEPNGILVGIVTKNGEIIYRSSLPMTPVATFVKSGVIQPGASYEYSWYTTVGAAPTNIDIPDTNTEFSTHAINVQEFQQAVLESRKLQFLFSSNDVEYRGTVLVPTIDMDSPDNAVSSFNTTLQGDGDLIPTFTNGDIPLPTNTVIIYDQFGAIVAIIPAPGSYNVLRFDTLDCRGYANPDLIIMPA